MKKFATDFLLPAIGGVVVTGALVWVIMLASNFHGF